MISNNKEVLLILLHTPQLAKCSNRSILAKVNPLSGEPEEWFDPQVMALNNLFTLSFDFFVNWNNNQIPNEVWLKKIVDRNAIWPVTNSQTLLQWINNLESAFRINNLNNFCNVNNFISEYLLFKEQTTDYWHHNPDEIVKFNLSTHNTRIMNPNEIQNDIYNLRGSRPPIGPGGLFYGTSSLECYLSNKPDFWPGDVDDLIVDSNNIPRAIIEYKKHNKNTPIQDQTITNYRNRDRKKYESLGLLRDRLSGSDPVKIFMVFYSTNPNINQIKIEEIEGTYNNLLPVKSWYLPLPIKNDQNSLNNYCQSIINLL